ncbi:hypothetical protein IIB79_05780 [candidate division KSB1 bacterium]|nr:hypothetical protein [candidate division KSB1 bacterium]
MDFANFLRHNFPNPVTDAELRRTVFIDQMAKRVMAPGFDISKLRKGIGHRPVWATRDEALKSADGSTISSDDLRDSLGLDDRLRYGAGKRMACYIYSSERVPDEAFYRPTVLDTGWHGAAVAFLPSDPTVHETGITQHLQTGDGCAPEVIHDPFAANEVERVGVTEPLANDPATGYRAIRLAN